VIAGDMLQSRKPEPDMLLAVIEELGGGAALYVGDSEIDSETAARANVSFALFSEGYRKTPVSQIRHDWVFEHFDALPEIVTKAATAGAGMRV
jgi:phosphoglycolate phosphatase